jgi:hypothetical protein
MYNNKYAHEEPRCNTNREVSDFEAQKPTLRRKDVKRRNQVQGAYLRP